MRIKFKKEKCQELINLLKATASNNRAEATTAREALAAFVQPAANVVLNQADTLQGIYQTVNYNFDDGAPSIPLPLFNDNTEGLFYIWSNAVPGGLATNEIYGQDDYRFRTYRLDTAISFDKTYAAKARLDVVAQSIKRITQELLVKRMYQGWSTLLAALGAARHDGRSNLVASVAKAASATRNLQIADFNKLLTFMDRLRPSWIGGTVEGSVGGITDIFASPEAFEFLRAMAYQPQNTTSVPDTAESTVLGLPDNVREELLRSAGTIPAFFGVRLHKLLELGLGRPFNLLLDSLHTAVASDTTFNGATEDVLIGLNLNSDSFQRAVAEDSNGDNLIWSDDDQFFARTNKMGFYSHIEEGYSILDDRDIVGLVY